MAISEKLREVLGLREKTAFGPEDATKVLQLAKQRQLPKAAAKAPSMRGQGLSALRYVETPQTGASPLAAPETASLLSRYPKGAIFRGEDSGLKELAGALPANQRKMLHAVAKGHELDELVTAQRGGFLQHGHISPDVILREHNRLVTLPSEYSGVRDAFMGNRDAEAYALKRTTGVDYGEGPRLSRHARRRITDALEAREKKFQGLLARPDADAMRMLLHRERENLRGASPWERAPLNDVVAPRQSALRRAASKLRDLFGR